MRREKKLPRKGVENVKKNKDKKRNTTKGGHGQNRVATSRLKKTQSTNDKEVGKEEKKNKI